MSNNRSTSEHEVASVEISGRTLGNSTTHVVEIDLFNADSERVNQLTLFGIESNKIKMILNSLDNSK